MGTFKDIASIFVKLDDESGEVPAVTAAPALAPRVPAPRPAEPVPAATTPDPAAEGKISEKLNQALEENNLPGIDFFEFRKTLEALVSVIGDEPTRYRAAFGSLVAQGAKGEQLVQTADHYLQVLDAKEAGFAQYMQDQERERVQDKLKEADDYQRQIREKSEAIARLTQEIGKLTESEVGARNAATLAKAELEAYKDTFQGIKGRFVADIQATREKIQQYVLNTPKA